jgi:hypothetical protein
MQKLSQNNNYTGGNQSQGMSSVYVYHGRVSVSRGQSISVIETFG